MTWNEGCQLFLCERFKLRERHLVYSSFRQLTPEVSKKCRPILEIGGDVTAKLTRGGEQTLGTELSGQGFH